MQNYGNDPYTTVAQVQQYLNRTLESNEQATLGFVIPAVSRWIDRTLKTTFTKLPTNVAFDLNNPNNPLCGWKQLHFGGGYREMSIRPCQQILSVQAINPYDFSVWYTYTSPLEYTAEPFDYSVKNSMRMNANEFTGNDLKWPGGQNSIMVTALFTEYDYDLGCYPNDIVLLANHISAVWMQNSDNTDPTMREHVEGHEIYKQLDDMLKNDPMVTRVLQSREEVWLEEM